MLYANDDMDDLVRRAAKEYPLNTNSGQWEKIASSLHNEDLTGSPRNKRNRRFFGLLLLIPGLLYQYTTQNESANRNNRQTNFASVQKNISVGSDQISLQRNMGVDNLQKPLPAEEKAINKSEAGLTIKTMDNASAFDATLFSAKTLQRKSHRFFKPAENATATKFSQADVAQSSSISAVETTFPHPIKFHLQKDISRTENIAILTSKPGAGHKAKRFYAGLVYGVGATTVKLQKVNNLGFDFGVVAGYDIGKKWSIEAGILSTQKKYYTDGKEFNTSKMYLSATTKIVTVEGGCRMIELPIVARYHFSSNQKNMWFVSGGISSFLMKEENYDYLYLYTNSGRTVKYSKTYREASESWVATAQFSGGFIYHVKDKFAIRAEPYIQVPLKGVGFGNLPLTNTGLRIGVTKKLF